MKTEELKIKVKSLAAESQMIKARERHFRQQTTKCMNDASLGQYAEEHRTNLLSLKRHRIGMNANGGLRRASRKAQLAAAFMRGHNYRRVEQRNKEGKTPISATELASELKTFGYEQKLETVARWLAEPEVPVPETVATPELQAQTAA